MAQTEAHLPAASRRVAARKALLNPVNLIPFPALAVLALARHYHLIADTPLWLLLGSMVFTQITTTAIAVSFPPGTPNARPRLLLTAQIVLIGLCVYVNGWGALLAVGFVFAAATAIHSDGSRYAIWAMACTALTVTAGELSIALGWVKTMIREPDGHGLALLEVAGTCAVIWILAHNQREKELVEGSLRQSERRFRALVQHASDIILVVASDGTVSYASPAFESVLGYASIESVGMLMNTIMDDKDVARLGDIDDATPQGREAARSETRLRHHDGSWRWFEVTFTNLFNDPSVEGWVANLRDISERKQSEAALRQAQEVFRHAFDEAGIGMTLVEPSGHIIRSNEAMQQMLGYDDAQALVGKHVVEITHPEDRRATEELVRDIERNRSDGFRIEKRLIRADGETVWVALTVSTVKDESGQPMFSIGQIEDITERKAFSDRLKYEAAHDGMTGLLEPRELHRARHRGAGGERVARTGRRRALHRPRPLQDHQRQPRATRPATTCSTTVAQRLRHTLRPGDLLARFGGDEFVVLCTNVLGIRARVGDRAAPASRPWPSRSWSATTKCS